MNGDSGYAFQKLPLAILILAIGKGDVRSRLSSAFYRELHVIRDGDFPASILPEWLWIKQRLTRKGPCVREDGSIYVGAVDNTLHAMRNLTGSKIAQRLIDLRDKLEGYLRDKREEP